MSVTTILLTGTRMSATRIAANAIERCGRRHKAIDDSRFGTRIDVGVTASGTFVVRIKVVLHSNDI